MLKFKIVPVTPFQQNCTVLWCDETAEAAIVDPGGDLEQILAAIRAAGADPVKILLTHGHMDHVGGTAELAERLALPIEGPHRDDDFLLRSLPQQARMFGVAQAPSFATGRWLEGGDRVQVGAVELEVIHCPGHTPGHVVFFDKESRLAQVGDVLFQGSIGRTDFPRGNHRDLLRSIRTRLFPLGDDVRFIPGHGPMSTFGAERRSNPFVGGAV
jgi:glyoxylase-like metal-dependent hydrolase (beta-lactamase superfamily II)